jgi:Cys-rich repeat protein
MNTLLRRILGIAALALVATHCGGASTSGAPPAGPDASSDAAAADPNAPDSPLDTGPANDGALGDSGLCEGTAGRDGAPAVPPEHRAQVVACTRNQGIPLPGDAGVSSCSSNADCQVDGAVGGQTCVQNQCSYDQCLVDADCSTGELCVCSADNGGGDRLELNVCVPAQCHVDSDCGAGQYCSPSRGYCGSVEGYYCHTALDTCVDPTTDCPCGGFACLYTPTVGHFVCGTPTCAG